MAYLDNDGLLYLWQKLKVLIGGKVDKVEGKGLSTNDYTTTEKTKLAGLSNYSLPNATSSTLGGVKVGSGLSVSSGTVSVTTEFTADEKTKLGGISEGANNYSLPVASSSTRGGVKIGYTASGKNYPVQLSSEKMYVNVPWENTTYSIATTSANGLMSSGDKTKLDAFSTADKYALKTDITSAVRYKGTKSTVAELPTTGNATGDMWNVSATDMNYVWNGTSWDAMSGTVTVDAITNSEIDTIVAS